jgi:dipeptidyl aminopeptidase/acylaminoacyl peptidase
MRPPDGSYALALNIAGATFGTSTVVIKTTGNQITAVEDASIPAQRVTAHTTTVYDAATLDEESYTADFKLPSGAQHTSVSIAGEKATIDAGTQHLVLTADSGAPSLLTTDNLPGQALWIPAIVRAHQASAISLAVLAGGRTIVENVQSDTSGALVLSAGGLTLRYSYDPKSGILKSMQVPQQEAQVKLVSQSASIKPAATASPLPTPLPLPSPQYRSQDVTFISSDGTKLAGTLTVPNGNAKRHPAIVLVHGSGPENRDEQIGPNPVFLQLANALSNAGFAVLRYDKRGIGRSGGNADAATRDDLIHDAQAGVAFVGAQPFVEKSRVFVLGHSEGGELVPSVAVATPGVAGIVLMAPPAMPLWQVSMEQVLASVSPARRAVTRQEEVDALNKIRSGQKTGPGMAWYRSSMDIDPAKIISQVRVPILILQGGADAQVLPKDLPRLVKAAKAHNDRVTVHVFPGDNHLFMCARPGTQRSPQAAVAQYLSVPGRIDPDVLKALVVWLRRV